MKYYHPNHKIYQVNVPSDYVLSNLEEDRYGKIRYPHDVQMMEYIYKGKTIGEGIRLVSQTSLFPLMSEITLCKRYIKIIKAYIHEYNFAKKRSKHNQETT